MQHMLHQWVHETDRPDDGVPRSPSASPDAYSPVPGPLSPPAQHGPPYAGYDNVPRLEQLGDWARQPSQQPVYAEQAGGAAVSGYGSQPHSPPQSYGQRPQVPMFGHQQPGFGQPAVVISCYGQQQDVGNGQQWHAQLDIQLPPDRQSQGHAHPPHLPMHAPEHQAWAQGQASHPHSHPQGPPQHGPGVSTPAWSSDQSMPPAPAQPGYMDLPNGHGHASGHASGYAVHGQTAGHAPQHRGAYSGAVTDPWQGSHGHAADQGQPPPVRFIPVEGGAETTHTPAQNSASGGSAWPQPHGAQAPVFGAPSPQGHGGQHLEWQARPAAPRYQYAYGAASAGAASPFCYAAPPPVMMRGAVHGAAVPTATARSGSGGSLPSPHQVGHRHEPRTATLEKAFPPRSGQLRIMVVGCSPVVAV